ncbi:MAG TPA: FHA domain-containing protein [Polyangiaceae bacterium]|jgi:pSer/pThr/pTyr-binding forkhead associated (FHA) protein|nr:FHA domain-containing protein [Polyangiaceae bacterium]
MVRGRFDGQAQAADPEDELVSSYWLRVGLRELPLRDGETLIGRGDGCHVVVNEAMVSRRHARIVVASARPYIEDLGSSNGTFVNQAKVHGFHDLFPGDRIFIGTCEIEVIRVVDIDRPTVPVFEDDLDRPTPASGLNAFDPFAAGRVTQPRSPSPGSAETDPDARAELEWFETTTHLADKMFTMGRVDAAVKILSGPLNEILEGARFGRLPGPVLLDVVGRYAVKLANDTSDGVWIDLAIETHLLAVRPLREDTIQKLAALRARVPIGSDVLIAQYYERLRGCMASFSTADRILSERVACLLPAFGP